MHHPNGFLSMNGGYEYTLALMAACVTLALSGSGEAALDKPLSARSSNTVLADLLG